MLKLSVVILAHNEEEYLKICLDSVVGFADEVIVIHSEGSGKTSEIARKAGAIVYEQPNHPMLNTNKNYGFEKATGDWILNLDADEELSPELKKEIIMVLNTQSANTQIRNPYNSYRLPRKNFIFGKWIKHSLWWPDYQLRLFKKGYGKFPEKHIHEYLKVQGETTKLNNPLIHHNYQTVSQFLHKMQDIYVESGVNNLIENKYDLNWSKILRAPVSDFIKNYFSLKGYKDGQHGLILNLLQSYAPLITLAKLWEKQGFPEKEINFPDLQKEFNKIMRELNYWLLTIEIKETKNPLKIILLKLKRKIINI